ncbi:hypothetical protein QG37_07868 [Candidozyma auris]|uniref:Uncharacterized protein n=1 Tax=Candidozyma auris TaxID=498019 RepID=A0A0L0NP41_CANAR|nr:hypothetical protein QG37_07868 [[Candida] auris]
MAAKCELWGEYPLAMRLWKVRDMSKINDEALWEISIEQSSV